MIAYSGALFLKESVIPDGDLSLRGRVISYGEDTLERFPLESYPGKVFTEKIYSMYSESKDQRESSMHSVLSMHSVPSMQLSQ